jgi:hypothetical protein
VVTAADFAIPDELLEHATEDELVAYIDALAALDGSGGAATWDLQDRQLVAEQLAGTQVDEVLYGGAAGGGKSEWILWHLYELALKYPGFKGLAIRRTFPELRRSLIRRSLERFDRDVCKYLTSEHVWYFVNGSTIEFGYVEHDRDVYQYQSAEYDCVAWDELTQFPTDFPYTYLFSRLRTRVQLRAMGLNPHVVAGTNPGNVGGPWVKSRFVDPGAPGKMHAHLVEIDNEAPREVRRVFIPAKLADNAYIDAGAYRRALANLPPAIRKALEEGSWDAVEGQYFTEWDRSVHVVKPFEIPAWWRRIRGIDFGYTAPMCCLWIAFDQDGNAIAYRELYGTEMLAGEQAKKAVAMSRLNPGGPTERIDYSVADPSVWARTGAGPPIAQQYADQGLHCRKASNQRIAGWQQVRAFLRIQTASDGTKVPGLRIFETCHNLVRTLPMLVHDQTHPEDLDTDGEDHAADALRYALMSRPLRSVKPDDAEGTPEEQLAKRLSRPKGGNRDTMTDTPVGDVR